MKIVIESIESKFNEPFFAEFKEIGIDAISKYIKTIEDFEALGMIRDLGFGQDNQAKTAMVIPPQIN
ncbi:hypothetical protein [Rheinheimera sp. SA_1]|uniref:hypothetical protein n=1 Tax=Rheinheimera sp. SA_1 TaxID=1827365 RepID=UPI0012F7DCB6|nr:hypothetical protein [Rheinheimera sp. SA_1]